MHACGPRGGPKDGFKFKNWCWKLTGAHRARVSESAAVRKEKRKDRSSSDAQKKDWADHDQAALEARLKQLDREAQDRGNQHRWDAMKGTTLPKPPDASAANAERKDVQEKLGKELWQRHPEDVKRLRDMPIAAHKKRVEEAIEAGKEVPQEVLDYHGLQTPKQKKAFERTKLYKDIAETLGTDDFEEISDFRDMMEDLHEPLAESARAHNEAIDSIVDQFVGEDSAGRKQRGLLTRQIRKAEDPNSIPKFDEMAQFVRDNPNVRGALQVENDGSVETQLFEALKTGKKDIPSLGSDEVWQQALEYLESAAGPFDRYERDEEPVPFSLNAMKKFWKEVIRPGKYTPANGKTVDVTPERIKTWKEESERLMANGNRIPIPYHHAPDAVPVLAESPSVSTYDCAGYVEDFELDDQGGLHALIDPATDDDAKNFNTKIRDVSIMAQPWKDGNGNEYSDVITHIAACYHPVMNKQTPFIPSEGIALSLTMAYEEDSASHEGGSATSLESAVQLLRDLGVELGDDVTPENFIERLCTAVRAVNHTKMQEEGDDFETRPEGGETKSPSPIAMSKDEKKEPVQFSQEQQAALDLLQTNNKLQLQDRIRKVVKSAKMREETGQKLIDRLNEVELQFSLEGSVDEDQHADIFLALNEAEASSTGAALTGRTIHDVEQARKDGKLKLSLYSEDDPDDMGAPVEMSDKEREELGTRLVRLSGR